MLKFMLVLTEVLYILLPVVQMTKNYNLILVVKPDTGPHPASAQSRTHHHILLT